MSDNHCVLDRVFMNLDAGELDSETEELWSLFDLLSCACGGHAGDVESMERVARFCVRAEVQLGAHPSYPDRDGFGRRSIEMEPAALATAIASQCGALAGVARGLGHAGSEGIAVTAIKPHGALYHDAAANPAIADALIRGATALVAPTSSSFAGGASASANAAGLIVIGPPRGALRDAALARGLRYAREGFADRRTRADGSLVPRTEANALITDPDEAAARAMRLVDVDTICVHADTPNALAIARAVRDALRSRNG